MFDHGNEKGDKFINVFQNGVHFLRARIITAVLRLIKEHIKSVILETIILRVIVENVTCVSSIFGLANK